MKPVDKLLEGYARFFIAMVLVAGIAAGVVLADALGVLK